MRLSGLWDYPTRREGVIIRGASMAMENKLLIKRTFDTVQHNRNRVKEVNSYLDNLYKQLPRPHGRDS